MVLKHFLQLVVIIASTYNHEAPGHTTHAQTTRVVSTNSLNSNSLHLNTVNVIYRYLDKFSIHFSPNVHIGSN